MEIQTETESSNDYLLGIAQQNVLRRNLAYFAENSGLLLDEGPFSFVNHEYLREPYKCVMNPDITELNFEKAAQGGYTVLEVIFCFHGMRYGRFPKGVLYLLPTEKHAEKVSRSKIQPIIDKNPLLSSWVSTTDSILQKRIGDANFILAGMETSGSSIHGGSKKNVNILSFSVDGLILDEFDIVKDWTQISLAQERMSHSEVTWQGVKITGGTVHRLSVPSVPEYGIDAYFAGNEELGIPSSDQRYLHFQCSHCNEWTCLEDEFPDCLVEVDRKTRKAMRICKKCKRELPLSLKCNWVPKKQDSSIRGYHYSQLFSAYVNPWKILDQFKRSFELTTLWNDKLGIPYVEAEARIEVRDITAICNSEQQFNSHPGPCAMGVDQPKEEGGKFHVTIGYRQDGKPCNVIRVCIRNNWAELHDLMEQFNVDRCVVDGLPDQDKARTFANDHRGKVFLCYYSEQQKGAAKWDEINLMVTVDRTESLNYSTRLIHERKASVPRQDDDIRLFSRHCHNIARKREIDEDKGGSVRQVWLKTGPDHYRHAFNYLCLALPEIREWYPPRAEPAWLTARKQERSWKTI